MWFAGVGELQRELPCPREMLTGHLLIECTQQVAVLFRLGAGGGWTGWLQPATWPTANLHIFPAAPF